MAPRGTTLPAARLIALISLAAGALGDSCVGLGCLTRGEHFWRGTDADGQPLLLNLVFSADKLSASGTLTTGTNTSEPFEATVSEEASELLITWSAGVQEWSGIVVAYAAQGCAPLCPLSKSLRNSCRVRSGRKLCVAHFRRCRSPHT